MHELMLKTKVTSSEQAFQLYKAALFNDEESFKNIANASTAEEAIELAERIDNYDPAIWNDVVVQAVAEITAQKFLSLESI